MKIIADLHIHSKYSRATSKNIDLDGLSQGSEIKGINVVGTGDFTHPVWFSHLKENLKEENGLYRYKGNTRFMLTSEISCIYKKNDKVRKIHILLLGPNLEAVSKLNSKLNKIGNIVSDGRPILGMDVKDLLELVLETSQDFLFIPAHIFTPWFSIFGSKSGFDSVEECFEDLSSHIYALETGLSADPPMIWRNPDGERLTLISNSDAHSIAKLGREATVFDTDLSYQSITNAIKKKKNILHTIEFFPEQGKYHYDGHRDCDICYSPKQSKENNNMCPACGSPLTIGVLNRAEELAVKEEGYIPKNAIPYKSIVPLPEVISQILGKGPMSKTVQNEYNKVLGNLGSEFDILLNIPIEDIKKNTNLELAYAIDMLRQGNVKLDPGYDGVFGKIKFFTKNNKQTKLL